MCSIVYRLRFSEAAVIAIVIQCLIRNAPEPVSVHPFNPGALMIGVFLGSIRQLPIPLGRAIHIPLAIVEQKLQKKTLAT